jgi:hypothetical protein
LTFFPQCEDCLRDSFACGVFKDVSQQRQNAATTKKDKVMKKTILLAVAVAGVLGLAASAQASDVFMSPRAQAQADSLKKVPAVASDIIERPAMSGTPKSIDLARSSRGVVGTNNDVDLARAPRPNMSPRSPGYEAAWRANAFDQQIQVAPLK